MSELSVKSWCSPSSHMLRDGSRMTDSPDSACETSTGNASILNLPTREIQRRVVSPFVPPPPPPPPSNGFHVSPNVLAPWIDSDGDSGIIRLGSTSSSETDHSSSGFPDNYFTKLHLKPFNWSSIKPTPPPPPSLTPLRGDHTITIPPHPTTNSRHSFTAPIKPLNCQRSMSYIDVHRNWRPNTNYVVPACSCHKACVHCGNKFGNRTLLRSTSDIPSRLTVKSPGLTFNPNNGSQDSVFCANDLIKVHALPASVIPEPPSLIRGVTPRQAKSADAVSRQRRLQKAFSMTSALDQDDFINAHARVASVIPMTCKDNKNNERLRGGCTSFPRQNNVMSEPKLTRGNCSSQYKSISTPMIRIKDDGDKLIEDLKDEPPVTYAKVNKTHKNKGKIPRAEGVLADDAEPPLPPRNYRSDSAKANSSRSLLAEKVQGFTRSAKGVLRKALGLDWLNERDGQNIGRCTQRNQRNCKPSSPQPQPLATTTVNSAQRTRSIKDQTNGAVKINDTSTANYAEI